MLFYPPNLDESFNKFSSFYFFSYYFNIILPLKSQFLPHLFFNKNERLFSMEIFIGMKDLYTKKKETKRYKKKEKKWEGIYKQHR